MLELIVKWVMLKRFSTGNQYSKSSDVKIVIYLRKDWLSESQRRNLTSSLYQKNDWRNFLAFPGVENLIHVTHRKLTSSGAGKEKIHMARKTMRKARLRLRGDLILTWKPSNNVTGLLRDAKGLPREMFKFET